MSPVQIDIEGLQVGVSGAEEGLAQEVEAMVDVDGVDSVRLGRAVVVLASFLLRDQLPIDVVVDALEAVQMVKHGEGRRVWCEFRVPNVPFADCVGGEETEVSFYCCKNTIICRSQEIWNLLGNSVPQAHCFFSVGSLANVVFQIICDGVSPGGATEPNEVSERRLNRFLHIVDPTVPSSPSMYVSRWATDEPG